MNLWRVVHVIISMHVLPCKNEHTFIQTWPTVQCCASQHHIKFDEIWFHNYSVLDCFQKAVGICSKCNKWLIWIANYSVSVKILNCRLLKFSITYFQICLFQENFTCLVSWLRSLVVMDWFPCFWLHYWNTYYEISYYVLFSDANQYCQKGKLKLAGSCDQTWR